MSHVDVFVLQSHLNRSGQTEQTQVVRDGRAVFTDAFTQFLLRQVVLFDKMLVGQCDLHRIQVFALDVLYQGHFHDIFVICRTYVCRDGVQAGLFGSSPAPFSGDDLKRVVLHLAECDGLYDADFRNGVGQLAQTFRVKIPSRLVGIRRNLVQFDFIDGRGTVRVDFLGGNQSVQSSS